MREPRRLRRICKFILTMAMLGSAFPVAAQEPEGPQTSPPPAVAPPLAPQQVKRPYERVTLPAGTRLGVVLENGLSTRNAKVGDSIYMRTSFPITQNNRIIIPVGSYVRGELVEAKRPGRIKGRGEFRLRLNTMIFPNGYTVDLLAVPRSADGGGKETTDSVEKAGMRRRSQGRRRRERALVRLRMELRDWESVRAWERLPGSPRFC